MNVVLPALILLALAGYILFTVIKMVTDIISGYRNFNKGYSLSNNPSRLTNDHPAVISLLNKYPYYKVLSREGKEKFANRLIMFLADKKFIGMNGLVITDEMRVLISAAAIQITFGLDKYMFLLFHTIRIYPGEFFSRLAETNLKGGATPTGIMLLSWRDFQEGFAVSNDKLNLGLHEMAHALILDMLYGPTGNSQLAAEIGNWEKEEDVVMEKMKQKNPNFLRAYGATNEQEFFAVSIEYFFEAPVEFKKNLPDMYFRLCKLLKQDPQNTRDDYGLRQEYGLI